SDRLWAAWVPTQRQEMLAQFLKRAWLMAPLGAPYVPPEALVNLHRDLLALAWGAVYRGLARFPVGLRRAATRGDRAALDALWLSLVMPLRLLAGLEQVPYAPRLQLAVPGGVDLATC